MKLQKFINEKKLPYSKKEISKALDIISDLEKSPAKVTDWDSRGNFEIEFNGKKEWFNKNIAVNKLFAIIQ